MTRFSFLLFTALLTGFLYALVWLGGAKDYYITYTLYHVSAPFIALTILMALLSTIRWFLNPDEDVMTGAITYWHATWLSALLTFIAMNAVDGGLMRGVNNIMHLVGH